MKLVKLIAFTISALAAMYLLLNNEGGLLHQNPLTVLGVSLVGLGLCREAFQREQAQRQATPLPAPAQSQR